MIRRIAIFAAALFITVGVAQDTDVTFSLPALVTSSGQSLDGFTAQTLLTREGMDTDYDNLATAEDLEGYSTLIIAVGASVKGFGSAGITAAEEVERTQDLLAAAKEQGVAIIAVHNGGEERRGGQSEQFIELVVEAADILVVTKDGNPDGYFDEASEELGIPLVLLDQAIEVGSTIAGLLE